MHRIIRHLATQWLCPRMGAALTRLRRAVLRIIRLLAAQSLRPRMGTTYAQRSQPRPRKTERAACFTELQCPVRKAWLSVRSRRTAATSMSAVSRPERKRKILTQVRFSLRRNDFSVKPSTNMLRSSRQDRQVIALVRPED